MALIFLVLVFVTATCPSWAEDVPSCFLTSSFLCIVFREMCKLARYIVIYRSSSVGKCCEFKEDPVIDDIAKYVQRKYISKKD